MENYDNDSQFDYEKTDIPTCLKVVAYLFIICGVLAVIEIIVSLMNNHININLGVLGIFIGFGLLKFKAGWRTFALVWIWLALIFVPIFAVLCIVDPSKLHYRIMGQNVGRAPVPVALAFTAIFFCLALWQYRVLTRPDIRERFLGRSGN